jgi:hypothetical protein
MKKKSLVRVIMSSNQYFQSIPNLRNRTPKKDMEMDLSRAPTETSFPLSISIAAQDLALILKKIPPFLPK